MRFWDSSAVVPLLVKELTTPLVREAFEADPDLVVWWATEVEAESALARRERSADLAAPDARDARGRLESLAASWREAAPTPSLRSLARRLIRVHDLRAADALQLAAALEASEQATDLLEFVCLDERLASAALREGFGVVGT